ncbi:hypothetical protein CHLRE_03g195150v5 [Chlamydomonas reinhardtii]|uniref:Uncharacterized protein n=1 Tax=Chlamydomonas reinhardtii TaxID=3055 RepID=A0A2K3DYK5_CHLRE|nr:uncharacterized protein CHLRE_03g195150v5 [Chlamydomonas reinhardtii]PNW85620.1 hypothetical protein CHLRE_03g195150v5 [Chlamydomonas reinhardtii]
MDVESRLAELRDEYERSRAFLAQLEWSLKVREPEPEESEARRGEGHDSTAKLEDSARVPKLDAHPASPQPQAIGEREATATSPFKTAHKGLGSRFTGWIKNKLAPGGHDDAPSFTRCTKSCVQPARRRASFATVNLDLGGALGGMGGVAVATYSPGAAIQVNGQLSYGQVPQGAPSPVGHCNSPGGVPSPSGGSFTLSSAAGGRGRAPMSRRASFVTSTIMRSSASNQVHPQPGGCGDGDGDGDGVLLNTDENGVAVRGPGLAAPTASGRLSGVLGSGQAGPIVPLHVAPASAPPLQRFPLRRSSLDERRPAATAVAASGSSRGLVPSGQRRASMDLQRSPPMALSTTTGAGPNGALPAVSGAEVAAAVPDELTEVQPQFLPSVNAAQGQQPPQQRLWQHVQQQQQQQPPQQQRHFTGYRPCFASEQQVWIKRDGSGGADPAPATFSQAGPVSASGTGGVAAARAGASASDTHAFYSGAGSSGPRTRFSGVAAMSGAGAPSGGGVAEEADVDDPMIAAAAEAYWGSEAAAEVAKEAAGVRDGAAHGLTASSPGAGDGGMQQQLQPHCQYQPPHTSSPQRYVTAAAAEPTGAAAAASGSHNGGGSTSLSMRFRRLAASPPALGVPGTGVAAARPNSTRPGNPPRRLSFEAYAGPASPIGLVTGPYEGSAGVAGADGLLPTGGEASGGQAWAAAVAATAPRAATSSSVSRLAVTRSFATPFGAAAASDGGGSGAAAGLVSGIGGPVTNANSIGASSAYASGGPAGRRCSNDAKFASTLLLAASNPAPSGGGGASSLPGDASGSYAHAGSAATELGAAAGSHRHLMTSPGSPAVPVNPTGSAAGAGAALAPTWYSQTAASPGPTPPQSHSPAAQTQDSGFVQRLQALGAWRHN